MLAMSDSVLHADDGDRTAITAGLSFLAAEMVVVFAVTLLDLLHPSPVAVIWLSFFLF